MKTRKRLRELLSNIVMKDWDWLSDTDLAVLCRFQTDDNALDALYTIVTRIPTKEASATEETVVKDLVNFALYARFANEKVDHDWRKAADLHRQANDLRPAVWRRLGKLPPEVAAKEMERLRPSNIALPIRSDKDGSRVRTLFCRDFSNLVHDLTGYRMDEEVAHIAGVVFDREIDPAQVRQARRQRTRRP
jgi:hypothetical protein